MKGYNENIFLSISFANCSTKLGLSYLLAFADVLLLVGLSLHFLILLL